MTVKCKDSSVQKLTEIVNLYQQQHFAGDNPQQNNQDEWIYSAEEGEMMDFEVPEHIEIIDNATTNQDIQQSGQNDDDFADAD